MIASISVSYTHLDVYKRQLLLCLHHLLSDGWSVQILLAEFAALYNAACTGAAAALPALTVQYADYAAWQREWLAGGEGARQLAYWREQLGDCLLYTSRCV